jgi:formate dehydrogenase major subunit
MVDLVTHWQGDDHVRGAQIFRIEAYQTPCDLAAAYYLETNR